MKPCPFCAEQIQDDAVFCRFCQRDLYPNERPLVPRRGFLPTSWKQQPTVHGKNEGCFLQTMNIGCAMIFASGFVVFLLIAFALCAGSGHK